MKNPTIWESAAKPLFVRTVWLEGSELRRGLQRHFLLDYENKKPIERLNSAINSVPQKKRETIKRSLSFELNEFDTDLDDFTLGSAKLNLHDSSKLFLEKRSKLNHSSRRNPLLKRKYSSYESYQPSKDLSSRSSDILNLFSRKNSLHDLKGETLDELLAERVLHWLDLKGKQDLLENLQHLKEMEVKLSKTARLRQDSIKRFNSKLQTNQSHKATKTKNVTRCNAQVQAKQKNTEAVKHITIIFNREGQPIRLNRPAKNIDLCTLSASPNTARRLAGSLASKRLYKSAENSTSAKTSYQTAKASATNKSLSALRRLDTVADLTNSNLQKRLHEHRLQCGSFNNNNIHDAKRQLHIFMPTLPKGGLAKGSPNTYNNIDDSNISELSHNFSELCRI